MPPPKAPPADTLTLIVPSSTRLPPTLTRSLSGPPATSAWPNSKLRMEPLASDRSPLIVIVPGLIARGEHATVSHVHIAANDPAATQRRARGDAGEAGRGRLVAVDQQRAGVHGRSAGIAVVPGQRDDAGALLRDRSRSRDEAAKADIVRAIEDQRAVVRHVAEDGAGGAAIAEGQGAARDRRAARIVVGAGQDQRTRTRFGESARTGNHAAECEARSAIGQHGARTGQRRVARAGDIRGRPQRAAIEAERTGGGAQIGIARDLQRPCIDRRPAGIAVDAGQDRSACADPAAPNRCRKSRH